MVGVLQLYLAQEELLLLQKHFSSSGPRTPLTCKCKSEKVHISHVWICVPSWLNFTFNGKAQSSDEICSYIWKTDYCMQITGKKSWITSSSLKNRTVPPCGRLPLTSEQSISAEMTNILLLTPAWSLHCSDNCQKLPDFPSTNQVFRSLLVTIYLIFIWCLEWASPVKSFREVSCLLLEGNDLQWTARTGGVGRDSDEGGGNAADQRNVNTGQQPKCMPSNARISFGAGASPT